MKGEEELRRRCAAELESRGAGAAKLRAFLGLDGFVDRIVHVVDRRHDAFRFDRIPTIASLAERLRQASGKSTNIELVVEKVQLGGNGPILASALARLGLEVTYVGALGWPEIQPVFRDLVDAANAHSIAESGHTDALEFEDGKVMLTRTSTLHEVTWRNIQDRFGRERFAAAFGTAELVGFVNWTMLPGMSEVWKALLEELCPGLSGPRRLMFFDLADPEKRTKADLLRALELIAAFERHFDVILGLNEKEAWEVACALDLDTSRRDRRSLAETARAVLCRVPVMTLVIHPVGHALAVTAGGVSEVDGPLAAHPMITTGAGDHFNAGFCLGRLLGLDDPMALLAAVSASGFFVRNGRSPSIAELAGLLRDWPPLDQQG